MFGAWRLPEAVAGLHFPGEEHGVVPQLVRHQVVGNLQSTPRNYSLQLAGWVRRIHRCMRGGLAETDRLKTPGDTHGKREIIADNVNA